MLFVSLKRYLLAGMRNVPRSGSDRKVFFLVEANSPGSNSHPHKIVSRAINAPYTHDFGLFTSAAKMAEHRLFPYFLIVTAGVIWGGTFSLALIATAEGAHPLALSAWQVVLTAAFFGVARLFARFTLFNLRHLRHYL